MKDERIVEYKTKFKVYKNGAVSIANVRYGPSTHIARCLCGIARQLTLEDNEKKAAKKDRMGILMDAKVRLQDCNSVTDAVLYVKYKYNLNEILAGDIEETLRKELTLEEAKNDRERILMVAKDKLVDGYAITDAVLYVRDKYNLNEILTADIEETLRMVLFNR